MLNDDIPSTRVWIHLFGGEQDGYRRQIIIQTTPPKKFYVWHVGDERLINDARGAVRMALQNKLATMAYELYAEGENADGEREILYRRAEEFDKETVTA